jgi:hypothetical protein
MNNLFLTWLQENIKRLFSKSPLFFIWWQRISFGLVLITAIPEFLQMAGIELPEPFNTQFSKIVLACSVGILWMARLSSQSVAVAVTPEGDVLKKTDETKLPFTAHAEQTKAEKPGGILDPNTDKVATTVITPVN